jgi:hypothetical protein
MIDFASIQAENIPDSCVGNEKMFLFAEFGVMTIPAVIMLIAGSYRMYMIKHIGVRTVRSTKIYYTKIAITLLIALGYLSLIPINYIISQDSAASTYANKCGHD